MIKYLWTPLAFNWHYCKVSEYTPSQHPLRFPRSSPRFAARRRGVAVYPRSVVLDMTSISRYKVPRYQVLLEHRCDSCNQQQRYVRCGCSMSSMTGEGTVAILHWFGFATHHYSSATAAVAQHASLPKSLARRRQLSWSCVSALRSSEFDMAA